jgi:acrylyl-CoA reductase (NADPH)/3-hydroxypropionyl-CoA dehydratase/3-hydroxypropionyl-CoA synthetase
VAGEITVERSDVMRGVGRGLERVAAWDAAFKSRVRVAVAEALSKPLSRVAAVVVVKHTGIPDLAWTPSRDLWAHDLLAAATDNLLARAKAAGVNASTEREALALPTPAFVRAVYASSRPEPVDAEFPLFVIYTSGSTGKPKGVVHTHGGYVAGVAHTMRVAFDVPPVDLPGERVRDTICVLADPGWITGQSYLISAALTTGTTSVVVEGSPLFPHAGRFASIIERHRVTIFKAGSTFLKAVSADPQNVVDVERYDRSTLRVATFCAEPVSPAIQEFGMDLLTPNYINSYWATSRSGRTRTRSRSRGSLPTCGRRREASRSAAVHGTSTVRPLSVRRASSSSRARIRTSRARSGATRAAWANPDGRAIWIAFARSTSIAGRSRAPKGARSNGSTPRATTPVAMPTGG